MAGLTAAWAPPVLGQQAEGTPQPADGGATPVTDVNREATMPDWRFSVVSINDPYGGALVDIESVPAELRVVGVQVILTNYSSVPMEVATPDVRLRDTDGLEYRGGDYIGEEPRLVSQILPDGERTRGWVWYAIPANAEIASIIFIAPRPTLRVVLDGA